MLQFLLFLFCLNWAPGLSTCPNGGRIECQDYRCPGGSYSQCNYNSTLREYFCDPAGCSGNPNRDPCSCLATYKGCHIQVNATDAVGRPTLEGFPQTTHSCVNSSANRNCDYDVHVLSTIRSNGDTINWAQVLSAGDVTVVMTVNGDVQANKSLVLVLLSHYPTNWILDIPSGVTIDKVLLSSYHVDVSDVMYSNGKLLSVEKVSNVLLPSLANGFDGNGDHTVQALKYLSERFGSVSSFTGTYESDRYTMTINKSPNDPGCTSVATQVPGDTPVISAQCHPTVSDSCLVSGFRSTCSGDGYCRCPNMQNVDECTCLVRLGSCAVEKTIHGANSAGIPSYKGRTQITSSCQANDNCQNSVHVISTYEARSTGFSVRRGEVSLRVSVTGEDTRPLILVLTSYYPIRWSISIPSGVVFEKVIVSSYYRYLDQTSVSYSTGAVTSVEKINCSGTIGCYADGYDADTVKQLQYVSSRYGPVSSWSSAYRTDVWSLNIERSGCTSETNTTNGQNQLQSCPVISRTLTTDIPTTRPSNPFTNSQPSPIPVPFVPTVPIVGSVVSGVFLLLIIAAIVMVICAAVIRSRKGSRSSQNPNTYTQPPTLGGSHAIYTRPNFELPTVVESRVVYTRPANSDLHSTTRTFTNQVLEHSPKPEPTSQGVLVDSAPPAYDKALNLPSKSDNPPSYRDLYKTDN